jgi:lipopolysaccharide transport system ATP-binding protein
MSTITVTNLGKAYKQYPSQWARLAEWLLPADKPRHHLHWVLQDINFTVNPGEAVGIVGINGAGKSTLLKMVTGTTQPTTGNVQISGRIAALLELGMGFHPDFTGQQNVYMAGQLLGYSIPEIATLMSEIEAFAEIGDYINQPVRVYSSGMQVRLAFSVATAVRPDVLIVDEALSVGDKYFSQKSFNRIQNFLDQGTTLLFVSHDSTAVKALCDRAILIEKGKAAMIADPESVIDRYNGQLLESTNKLAKKESAESFLPTTNKVAHSHQANHVDGFREMHAQVDTGEICLVDFVVLDANGKQVVAVTTGDEITIRYRVRANANLDELYFGISIRNNLAISIFNTNTYAIKQAPVSMKRGALCQVAFKMRIPIQVGNYGLCMGVASCGLGAGGFERYLLNIVNAEVLEVLGTGELGTFGGIVDLSPSYAILHE